MYSDISALDSEEVMKSLDEFEGELSKRETPYFSGKFNHVFNYIIK